LLPDARVLVAGSGDSYGGPNQTTAELFEPPYLFKGARPSLTGAPTVVAHVASFSATTNGTIAKVSMVRAGADTHQFDEDTRFLNLPFTQNGNQLSITAPANANVAPPGYYMLYAISTNGVPSQASFVRLPEAGGDNVAPSAPSNLAAIGALGRVDLSWTSATDNVGVTGYSVYRSTTAGFTPRRRNKIGQTTTATTYADTGRPAGTYYYRVIANDAAGNVSPASNEAAGTALADTVAPTVSVTAPANGATVSATINVTAGASDNVGVAGVQFRLDGASPRG